MRIWESPFGNKWIEVSRNDKIVTLVPEYAYDDGTTYVGLSGKTLLGLTMLESLGFRLLEEDLIGEIDV